MTELYDKILTAGGIDEFAPEYASHLELSKKWQELALEKIDSFEFTDKNKTELDCHSLEVDGVEYHVYGVIHGWTGAGSGDYRSMIRVALAGEDNIIYEKMLGRMYAGRGCVETPDFCVLRWWGQIALSLRMILVWPLFLLIAFKDIILELFTRHERESTGQLDNISYHQLDPELRRGIDGSLPTRLQVEYEMSHWCTLKGVIDSYLAFGVVPRSAYIAEFALNWARIRGVKKLAIVVGDRHLTEVLYFLENRVEPGWLRVNASNHARRIARFGWYYNLLFAEYFAYLMLGGFIGFLPWVGAYLAWLLFF